MSLIYVVIAGVLIASSAESLDPSGHLPPLAAAGGVSAALMLSGLLSAWLSRRAVRMFGREPIRGFVRRSHRLALAHRAAVVGLYAVQVYLLDWPWLVYDGLGLRGVLLADDVVLLAPFVLMLAMSWGPSYRLEQVVRGSGWSFWQYAAFQSRHYVAIVLLPWLLFVAAFDAADWALGDRLEEPLIYWGLSGGMVAMLYVMAPVALRHIWRTHSLPPGELRDGLESICEHTRLRCRDILVWDTGQGRIANACIAGVWRGTRYILLTDALLRHLTPPEIESVFAHEVGHVKRHHMLFYVWLTVCYVLVHTMVSDAAAAVLDVREVPEAVSVLATAAVYWYFLFGFVSRRLEQEADLYAAQVTGSAAAFTSALKRITLVNGMDPTSRSWRHFSVARRIGFLLAVAHDPNVERRFRLVMLSIRLAALALALVGSAYVASMHWPE